jgi:hypothetical protein
MTTEPTAPATNPNMLMAPRISSALPRSEIISRKVNLTQRIRHASISPRTIVTAVPISFTRSPTSWIRIVPPRFDAW